MGGFHPVPDAVEILGPCRPARHTLRVIMTRLVAQHGALAGVIRAGGTPFVDLANHFEQVEGRGLSSSERNQSKNEVG